MANLPETEDFAEGTYQIETSDRVLGGPGGISNKQAEQLGNRTAWLRAAITKIINGTTAIGKATQLAKVRTLRFKGAVSGSGNYDGSADTEITLTLADSGVLAGSYTKVNLNAKGLATGGGNPTTLIGYGIRAATSAEVATGIDDEKPVTSLGVAVAISGKANKANTLSGYGVPVATSAEVIAGVNDSKPVTSLGVADAIAGKANKATTLSGYGVPVATSAEVVAGSDDAKPVTSLGVAAAIAGKANKASTLSGYGVPVATSAEVVAGSDDAKPVTSLGVAAAIAGKANKASTLSGYGVPVATSAEVVAGVNDSKPVTSLGVAAAISGKANKAATLSGYGVPVATSAEVVAGVNDSKPVTSLGVADAIKAADPWAMQPIGVPIPVFDNMAGALTPPTNKHYRYITLTASDSYNAGVLTSEVISGSSPLVTATAVINSPGSALHGITINLINTEQRVLRGALTAGQLLQDAFQGHWHDPNSSLGTSLASGGNSTPWQIGTSSAMAYSYVKNPITDGANGAPRTASETRSKSIGVTYFMRVK